MTVFDIARYRANSLAHEVCDLLDEWERANKVVSEARRNGVPEEKIRKLREHAASAYSELSKARTKHKECRKAPLPLTADHGG